MITVALFPNSKKPQARHIATNIKEYLGKQKIKLVIDDEDSSLFDVPPLSSIDIQSVTYAISLGGDGTILRLIHRFPDLKAPIFGVNLGSLGFLADIPVTEIYPALEELIKGETVIQERIVIEGETLKGESCFAVNDMVIHRAHNPSLIELAIHVDGKYLNTFSADGIIVATPSGSTAYSLASGGPILTPELSSLVITPICPHTISNRPIVLEPKQEIQIQYLSENQPVEISYDGISEFGLKTGEVFRIRLSKTKKFSVITLRKHDFFATVRSKLGWTGGSKRQLLPPF